MAGVWRRWAKPLAMAALMLSAWAVVFAQSAPDNSAKIDKMSSSNGGALVGRVMDLRSTPLEGATVTARNEATGFEAHTVSGKNGFYRFTGLEPGEYTLEVRSPQLGLGRVEGIAVAAGHEARVQAALAFEPLPSQPTLPQPVLAAAPLSPSAPTLASMPVESAPPPVPPPPQVAKITATPAASPAPVRLPVPIAIPQPHNVASAPIPPSPPPARPNDPLPPPSADPVAPVVTTTLTGEQLQQMPLTGRHWQNFVLDTPTASTPAGSQQQASLRGVGQQPSALAVDGASKGLAFGGTSGSGTGNYAQGGSSEGGATQSAMGQAWVGGHAPGLASAAIREVQAIAGNVESAASRSAGGRLSVESLHGSNGLHGQGFLSDRQNIWGARNPFSQWVQNTGTAAAPIFTPEPYTPPDHETTWGLGVGSQILRNKLFWFGAVDHYQRNDPGLATVKHPYLCASSSANGQCIPAGFFAPPSSDQMLAICARLGLTAQGPPGTQPYCPLAQVTAKYSETLESLAGLLGPAPRMAAQWVGFGRIDWQASERHRFTFEGTGARWNSVGGGITRVTENYGNHSFGSSAASEEWLMSRWEAYITPNLLAVTQGSAGREILTAHPDAPSTFENTFLKGNQWGQLPQIVVDSRYGFTIGNPSRFGQGSYPDEHQYQAREIVDWVHGKLLLRSGFQIDHNTDATSLLRNQTGTYYYSSLYNFVSDALSFAAYGTSGQLNPFDQHNCDQTGKVWRDPQGGLHGLGYLPCYSYYSQSMGPTYWWLSTNDWSGFSTTQWQPMKQLVISAGLRFDREQRPPPIASTYNQDLPLTQKLPALGNNFGPRFSLALGSLKSRWPVLRMGYGMYFGRTENATLETLLTQTGSLHGDVNFFTRPTDDEQYHAGGAPPFPYVPFGKPGSVVKPGAVELAAIFRNPEVHQAVVAVEETLPSNVEVIASAMVSLGRRLPVSIDTNIDPTAQPQGITYAVVDGTGLGPIRSPRVTVPFYTARLNPSYQQITQVMSRANSTYEAFMLKVTRNSRRGLSLRAHYTYSHAMDWNPNETTQVAGSDVLDPTDFGMEYGTSNLDVRHSAAVSAIFEAPWKLSGVAGKLADGWMVSSIGNFRGGMPFTMRTSGSLPKEFNANSSSAIVGLGPSINGSGGDNRIYGTGSNGILYNIGRNTFRYPSTWKADMRLARRFNLGHERQLQFLAESFNLFNHQNVTELETTGYYIESGDSSGGLPTLNFMSGLKANTTAFGQPISVNGTNFYRERQIQFGLRLRF